MQARIWNNSTWVSETDPAELKELFDVLLRACGFKVLSYTEHHFQPQGFTALWLLAESHFALHTFPEFGRTYIELSSCNPQYFEQYIERTKNMT